MINSIFRSRYIKGEGRKEGKVFDKNFCMRRLTYLIACTKNCVDLSDACVHKSFHTFYSNLNIKQSSIHYNSANQLLQKYLSISLNPFENPEKYWFIHCENFPFSCHVHRLAISATPLSGMGCKNLGNRLRNKTSQWFISDQVCSVVGQEIINRYICQVPHVSAKSVSFDFF